MGSICLSSASILRCASLTRLENVLLVIPTAVEVIFSTVLIFVNWGKGRRHLLLTAEGWTYFVLVLIEMFSEIIPALQMNLSVFRAFDLGIGVASFLPLLFYTLFLFLFASHELADKLPKGLQIVAKLALILFIPAIIIFNEVASFVGVTIRNIPTSKGQYMTAVGFTSKEQESLWTFFTSITLAIFTIYQAVFFFFAFFRVIQVLLHQRRIEKEGSDKMHFLNGIAWMSGGAKLGALEIVVGFTGGGFGISLTRRIIRFLSRACFFVGVIKGPDMLEDFQAVQGEIIDATNRRKGFRRSRLRQFISEPRLSTFRQLSPTAATFHATPRAPANVYISEKYGSDSLFLARKPQRQSSPVLRSGLPDMEQFIDVKEKDAKKRVTVHYNNGTPKLLMRFSTFDLPDAPVAVEDAMPRPPSAWYDESVSRKSRFTIQSKYSQDEQTIGEQLQPPRPRFLQGSRADVESSRDSSGTSSSANGSFQIVVGQQRRLSPTQAHIYQTPASMAQAPVIAEISGPSLSPVLAHNVTPETMAVMTFPEPIQFEQGQGTQEPPQDNESLRHKSMASVKSMPDSLKAVHELASQFPGPPMSSFQRPASEEVTSPESVLYPPGIMAPQVIGSPSQLLFGETIQIPYPSQGRDDNASPGSNNSQFPSPSRAGRVPVTPSAGKYRISGTQPRTRRRNSTVRKTIDPFDDDGSTDPIGQTPRSMRQEMPEGVTPLADISEIHMFQAVPENTPSQDRFVDLGMALDTGISTRLVPMQKAGAEWALTMSKSPHSSGEPAYKDDKFSRIAEWVDSSAAVAGAPVEVLVEEPLRASSLQKLDDNFDAPWRKVESERSRARASSAKKPRIKSFGRAPNKPTPTPVYLKHTRGSLHLKPIVIPPRTEKLTEAVQIEQIEYSSLESAVGRSGLLKDPQFLGAEDNDAEMRKKGSYF